jgi:AcrR family transcriptional regulator
MYGLEKATMREIASELNISKGALYYYFSDKEQLYKAVVEKEQEEFIQLLTENLSLMSDPSGMLLEYIEIRMKYFRNMLNLSRFRLQDFRNLKPLIGDTWIQFQDKEVEIVEQILNEGIKQNIFFIEKPHDVAQLFLNILKGLRKNEFHEKELFYLNEDEYIGLVTRTFEFVKIFIKGLKNKEN